MDSGNSGSISSSGDEEYDDSRSRLPSTFLNQPIPQFVGSMISHHPQTRTQTQQSSLIPSFFDLSQNYLHTLSHSQPNPFLNLETTPSSSSSSHGQRSEPNCTINTSAGVSSLAPPPPPPQDLVARGVVSSQTTTNNAARNSKKRTRASRRAPTTVLTTDTSNFRAMVQEFTGIPAPPFSASSYSRRLDLLTASSSLRSSSSHFDTFYHPLRPSPQKHHPNPLFLSSSSPPSPSMLLHNNNNSNNNNSMVDAIASSTTNNSSSNYQLPPDLGLPYNHNPQNFMLGLQNNPILTFHPAPSQRLHHFGAKSSQAGNLSVQSLEDLGVNQGQVNAHLVAAGGVSVPTGTTTHGYVSSEGMTLRFEGDDDDGGGGGKVASCKLNFSGSASNTLNHDKTLENNNNNNNSSRGEGAVDSWICSSD